MKMKLFGAIIVIAGCGGWGFILAMHYRKTVGLLRSLTNAIAYMECELRYRVVPLPVLCAMTAEQVNGSLRQVFLTLGRELEAQVAPNAALCMDHTLVQCADLPNQARAMCHMLGNTLGRFDLDGQLQGLEAVRTECGLILSRLQKDQDVRLRSYQTLGLCAGAAMVILFI